MCDILEGVNWCAANGYPSIVQINASSNQKEYFDFQRLCHRSISAALGSIVFRSRHCGTSTVGRVRWPSFHRLRSGAASWSQLERPLEDTKKNADWDVKCAPHEHTPVPIFQTAFRRWNGQLLLALAPLLVGVCLIGNLVTILGFRSQIRRQQAPYKHQISLVISDIVCICAGIALMIIQHLIPVLVYNFDLDCSLVNWLRAGTISIQCGLPEAQKILLIVTVLDRLQGIIQPLEYRFVNQRRRVAAANLASYTYGIGTAYLSLFHFNFKKPSELQAAAAASADIIEREQGMSQRSCVYNDISLTKQRRHIFNVCCQFSRALAFNIRRHIPVSKRETYRRWNPYLDCTSYAQQRVSILAFILFYTVTSLILLFITILFIAKYRKTMSDKKSEIKTRRSAFVQQRGKQQRIDSKLSDNTAANNSSQTGGFQGVGTSRRYRSNPSNNNNHHRQMVLPKEANSPYAAGGRPIAGTSAMTQKKHQGTSSSSTTKKRQPTPVRTLGLILLIEVLFTLLLSLSICQSLACGNRTAAELKNPVITVLCSGTTFSAFFLGGFTLSGNFLFFIILSRDFRLEIKKICRSIFTRKAEQ